MLFTSSDLEKKEKVLSGGERVRLSLVMILLSSVNVLLLDEPTNFLDIRSLQALENVLCEYPGTIIFTSHDSHFVSKVATKCAIIQDEQIKYL